MRSVVVLPAPLGPSRPVISPSRASKPTSSTATTRAWSLPLPGKVLRRCSAMIMCGVLGSGRARRSRLPAVERGEGGHVAEVVQALAVERLRVRGLDEAREQLGHAAGADHVV